MLRAICRCLLATYLIAASAAAARAAGPATVRGAEVVNVREGPSLDSPAFYSLEKGRTVVVERVIGDWAEVRLESGRQGYVRSLYLTLPPDIDVLPGPTGTVEATRRATQGAATPTAASQVRATREPTEARASATETATSVPAAPTPADTQVPAAPPAAGVTGAGEEAGLGDEVAELRKRLAALESVVVATPAAGDATPRLPGAAHPPASHEGARPFLVPTAELPNAQDLGPSLAMAGVGVVIGFLLGAAYGRRQERNRRSRVRF